jgi:hypothetical protein
MFECKICGRDLFNPGGLGQHIPKCERLSLIKDDVIKLYVNDCYSVRDLRKKFKLQSNDIKIILGDKIRSLSESNKLAHKKYPEKFKHSDETKKKLREDNKKDKLLNDLGWLVVRISEKEIKTNIENVFNEIISILKDKPKINNHRIGLVVKPKKYQKKERNEFGFTELEILSKFKQRKVERPPLSVLLDQTKKIRFPKTGKLYNVSENTIRKWIKAYHKGLG